MVRAVQAAHEPDAAHERKEESARVVKEWKQEISSKTFARGVKMGKQYAKKKRLGAGAFGEGWLCSDAVNHRDVVVKIAHAKLAGKREEYAAKKEVALMEAMDHPNVVKFYEAWIETGRDGGERLHIAMEYCDAGDLGALLKGLQDDPETQRRMNLISKTVKKATDAYLKGYTPEQLIKDPELFAKVHARVTRVAEKAYDETVKQLGRMGGLCLADMESWMIQLLWGVWYIHKQRVVHRDLKPDNIFLAGGGKIIKIGDFGVSGLQAFTNADMKTNAGTPVYMAPEMWAGGSYNDRVDVFALGCVMYEICALTRPYAARLPFAGSWGQPWGRSNIQFLKMQLKVSGVRPVEIPQSQVENSLFEVVKTMLRKDPKVRPTVGQVLRSIRMQTVARRVIGVFKKEGLGADDPLVNNTDARHRNMHNPANTLEALHDTARFQASKKDSQVLVMTSRHRVTLRKGPSTSTDAIGFISQGDIIEVLERVANAGEDCEWMKTQSGWCPRMLKGAVEFGPCPENLISRDENGVKALVGAYGAVVDQVQIVLQNALRGKISNAKDDAAPALAPVPPQKSAPRDARPVSPRRAPVQAMDRPAQVAPRKPLPFHVDPAAPDAATDDTLPQVTSPPRALPVKQASPKGARPPVAVGVKTPTAAAAAEKKRKQEEDKAKTKELFRLRDLLSEELGEAAQEICAKYFKLYLQLIIRGKMKTGDCEELREFEQQLLRDDLKNNRKVLSYIRKSAQMNYPPPVTQ